MRTLSHGRATRKHVNDRWLTPLSLIRALGRFDLDPRGAPGHPTADAIITPESHGDGLSIGWSGRVFLNPPYGRLAEPWLRQMAMHGHGTALIFARTDTSMFQDWVFPYADALLFVRGRIKFLTPDGIETKDAGAPSVLVAYGTDDADRLERSGIAGHFVRQEV